MRLRKSIPWMALLVLALGLVGCAAATPAPTATPVAYTDPFTYCANVGTVDEPGPDYTGPKVPESVAQALQTALNAPDTPINVLENGSVWRCADGSVYGCFVGANLPCEAKADTSKTPTQAETDYCTQNPTADFIPADVTGRETVYAWACSNGTPEITQQIYHADAQGYIAEIWYKLSNPN